MFVKIILNFFCGLVGGYVLELLYRSIMARRFVRPLLSNALLYAYTTISLYILYVRPMPLGITIALIFIIPTCIEFLVGYYYMRIRNIRPWSYQSNRFNYKGLICLEFSAYWFVLALVYYFILLPLILQIGRY